MDKGLKIQVELSRKGGEIFSRILKDIEDLKGTRKTEYLLSTETVINISDTRIWVYGIIKDGDSRNISTFTVFENWYQSRIIVKELLIFYLVNSEYMYSINEEDISEEERRTIFKLFPSI